MLNNLRGYMPANSTPSDSDKLKQILDDARRNRQDREKTYRERALKLFPWICGRCGREFAGKKLRELTVHHKDHNHDNNPPDGSNWELMCIYCHDEEHARHLTAESYGEEAPGGEQKGSGIHHPFANLDALLKGKK